MNDKSLLNDLDVRIAAAVQQALSNLDLQLWQQNATPAAEAHIRLKQFKSAEIEFFNSEQNVEDDKLWIQNVFIFIQRIKNVMTIQENETVQSNLSSCLQEAVTVWYHDHLNDIEKTELKSDLNL